MTCPGADRGHTDQTEYVKGLPPAEDSLVVGARGARMRLCKAAAVHVTARRGDGSAAGVFGKKFRDPVRGGWEGIGARAAGGDGAVSLG